MVLCWIHGSMEIGGVVVEPPVCLNSSTPRNVLLKRHAIFCGECTKNLCCQCHRNDGTHAFEAFFLQSYAGIWLRLFNVHLLHCTKYKIHSQGFTKYKFPSFRCFFEQKSKRIELTLNWQCIESTKVPPKLCSRGCSRGEIWLRLLLFNVHLH